MLPGINNDRDFPVGHDVSQALRPAANGFPLIFAPRGNPGTRSSGKAFAKLFTLLIHTFGHVYTGKDSQTVSIANLTRGPHGLIRYPLRLIQQQY